VIEISSNNGKQVLFQKWKKALIGEKPLRGETTKKVKVPVV